VRRDFVVVCRRLNLFSQALVAIDGSKFKVVNHRDKNFTEKKMKTRQERVERHIARYLAELDEAEHCEQPPPTQAPSRNGPAQSPVPGRQPRKHRMAPKSGRRGAACALDASPAPRSGLRQVGHSTG
jgi:hypothetical protein